MLHVGILQLEHKVHKTKKDRSQEWILTFKDPDKNTLKIKVPQSEFNNYEPGDPLELDDLSVQSTI